MWIKTHIIDVEKAKAAAQNGGLKIAGSSGDMKQEDAFGVVLSVDKDEATQRAERDREAAAKRQQNLLPAWHLKSTISGDLTALGIRENMRTEEGARAGADANRLPSSNDAILRGLGAPGPPPTSLQINGEDVKPIVMEQEADCEFSPVTIAHKLTIGRLRLRQVLCLAGCSIRRPDPGHAEGRQRL